MGHLAVLFDEARQRLPLKRLMEQYGRGPENGIWKSFRCPYCGQKKSAGVFTGGRGDLFKCHHSNCPSGTQQDKAAWDEIGFLAYETKLSRREASVAWLQQAGVWKENMNLPSTDSPNDQANAEPSHDHSNQSPRVEQPGEMTAESWCSEGAAAVPPTPSPFADGVTASPAGPCGPPPSGLPPGPVQPNPSPGEASLSPASAGAGESDAAANGAGGSAPPTNFFFPPAGGDGDGPPGGFSLPPAPGQGPLAALRAFYEKLTLTSEDASKLWTKRGLTPEICAATGLISSQQSNREVLQALRKDFDENVLLAASLYTREDKPGAEAKPNPQYYGWGVAGKDAEGNDTFGWTRPILIPYLDSQGEVLDLRPHKRTQRGQSPRLFVPRVLKKYRDKFPKFSPPRFGVVTEGEFKAIALFQVLGNTAAIAAIPGITLSKSLFGDIEDWLCEHDLKQVVVAFDNEEKGDPALPGYKPEPRKRYDTEVWARYLARQLAKESYDARVAHLPNKWRCQGKADWDGALALLIANSGVKGERPIDIWRDVSGKVRAEFLEVIKGSMRPGELWQSGCFEPEAEKIIFGKLEHLTSELNLPAGGETELVIARRLRRLYALIKNDSERMPPKQSAFLLYLGKQYEEVKGAYYRLKELTELNRERWMATLDEAGQHEDVEVKRACEIVLEGIPERVSDFILEPLYVVKKPNNTRERIVNIVHRKGLRTEVAVLPSSSFRQPTNFREWLMNACTGATWKKGERELNDLQEDVFGATLWREITEIPVWGYWEGGPGLRLFGDVVYTPDDEEIIPDRHRIVWYKGVGYRLPDRDQENQEFCQKVPLMRPHIAFTAEQTRHFFQEVSRKLFEGVGNYGGYLALGAVLAYGAAKEFFETYTAFPGLWIYGEASQGKSSLARWLLRIWGFLLSESGLALPDSSKVGISIAVQQYGDLPIWLEEFQPLLVSKLPWMTEKLKELYNRERGMKKTFDEIPRRVRTNAIVTGIGTSSESQLRSRYCHVQISKEQRENYPDHYDWLEKNSLEKFFLLGRHILRNRREFAARMMKAMEVWLASEALRHCEKRARIVHGASYCAFLSLVGMLESHTAEDMLGFRKYLHDHVEASAEEVQEQSYINQLWTDVMAAHKEGIFGQTPSERGEVFKAVVDKQAACPVSEAQYRSGLEDSTRAWQSVRLYFLPDSLIARLRQWLRKQGRELPLDKSDFRAQMKTQPYWVEPTGDCHRQKFAGAKSNQACWGISLDKHELGLRQVCDAEFAASFTKEDGNFFATEDWVDPRKGDLFALVESLKPKNGAATNGS